MPVPYPKATPPPVFRRRTTTSDSSDAAQAASEEVQDQQRDTAQGGKGRPTPKRREAEAARKARVQAPKDRKDAVRQQRAKSREARAKMNEAMNNPDEKHERSLPARDRGPIRRFVRNYVDARRTPAEYLLPYFLVIFVIMLIPLPIAQTIALAMWVPALIFVPLDLVFLGFRLRRELREKFPDESHRGAVSYGVMRGTQLRRLRLPKPLLKPGQPIPPVKTY
jgi:hypothetical protein